MKSFHVPWLEGGFQEEVPNGECAREGTRNHKPPLSSLGSPRTPLLLHSVDQKTFLKSLDSRGEELIPPLDGELSRQPCRRTCWTGESLHSTLENAPYHSMEIYGINLYDRMYRNV